MQRGDDDDEALEPHPDVDQDASAIQNITGMLLRARFDQKSCGTTTLQKIIIQKTQAYGPNGRG